MTIRVKIDHIGAGGEGVVHGPDGPIYVPFSVEGDDLEIDCQGKQAKIKHIHAPSSDRIDPICRHFGRCGGCSLQHISRDHYQNWKQQQITTALSHRGFEDAVILPPIISSLGSRRRASLTAVGQVNGQAVVGFAERASHTIVDISECPVLAPEIMKFLPALKVFLGVLLDKPQRVKKQGRKSYRGKSKPSEPAKLQKLKIQINLAKNGLDVVLQGAGEPDLDLRMDSASFAEQQDIARLCWLDTRLKKPSIEILCERRTPYVTFSGRQVFIPPGSFLQATNEGEAALTRHMMAALVSPEGRAPDKVVDIFAGCGTFTIAMIADYAVHAVEGSLDMVTAMKQSAHQMGKIRALTTEVRDLFLRPLLPHELKNYDAVVIDPPRAGAKQQIEELVNSDITNVVMVSCNPATFARDARSLVDAGFVMGEILPVDQFLFSPHLEVIAGFRRAT